VILTEIETKRDAAARALPEYLQTLGDLSRADRQAVASHELEATGRFEGERHGQEWPIAE
jgi:hypothetical protein